MTVVPFRKQRLLSAKAIGMCNKDITLNQLQSAPSPPHFAVAFAIGSASRQVTLNLCLQVVTRFGMGLTNFDQLGP